MSLELDHQDADSIGQFVSHPSEDLHWLCHRATVKLSVSFLAANVEPCYKMASCSKEYNFQRTLILF